MTLSKFLFLLSLVTGFEANAFTLGYSDNTDYGKELQNIYASEQNELYSIKKTKHRINWERKLNLNNEQKIYIKNLMLTSRTQIDEQIKIIKDAYAEINNIYQQDDVKIRAILNSQQQSKFDKIKKRVSEAEKNNRKSSRPKRKRLQNQK